MYNIQLLESVNFQMFYSEHIPNLQSNSNSRGWVSCSSPFRDDKKPSFSVNMHHGGYRDFGTNESGNIFDFLTKKGVAGKHEQIKFLERYSDNAPQKIKQEQKNGNENKISAEKIQEYKNNLLEDKFSEITKQIRLRKIDKNICKKFFVGTCIHKYFDTKSKTYAEHESIVIPYVFDENGNVIDYKLIPYFNGSKICNLIRSYGFAQIFPVPVLKYQNLILCEGELDALSLISNGINAVTFTSGAGTVPENHLDKFSIKNVTILYDNDSAGESGADKVASKLIGIANSVKIAHWNNSIAGFDVGEFFIHNDNINNLTLIINNAKNYRKVELISNTNSEKRKILPDMESIKKRIYRETDSGYKLRPSELAKFITESDDYPICSIQPEPSSAKRIFYRYGDGYWQVATIDSIRRLIMDILTLDFTDYQVNQVVNILGTLTNVDKNIFNSDPDLINLNNCAFNLRTFEPIEHSPNLYFTYKNEYNFDPKARCPNFDIALENYSKEKYENVDFAWIFGFHEIAGYCLTGNYEIHVMFWLFGPHGGEGKSTLCRVLSLLVGPALTKPNLDPKHLDGQFYKVGLIGKRLAITGELPPSIKNIDTIKQLTGQDEQSSDQKFSEFINFTNKAKLVFSMNSLPIFAPSIPIDPIIRRIYLLPFDNPLKEFSSDIEDTFRAELPGIFNAAISGLKRLRQNHNQFTVCKRAQTRLDLYSTESNMVAVFVDSKLKVDKNGSLWSWEVWDRFNIFMDENSIRYWENDKSNPSSSTQLGKLLVQHILFSKEKQYCSIKKGSYIKYQGIAFQTEDDMKEKCGEQQIHE